MASTVCPEDLVLSSGDGAGLLLFGYSTKPDRWVERLRGVAGSANRHMTAEHFCELAVEPVATWAYPEQKDGAVAYVLEAMKGAPSGA